MYFRFLKLGMSIKSVLMEMHAVRYMLQLQVTYIVTCNKQRAFAISLIYPKVQKRLSFPKMKQENGRLVCVKTNVSFYTVDLLLLITITLS